MILEFTPDKRYAGYFRGSTLDQEHSLDGQENELDTFADTKGIKITNRYYDEGKTGTNMNRNGLMQLVEDAKKSKFDVLLVWRVDRLARNVEEYFCLMNIFRKSRILVYSVKESLLYTQKDLLMCFMKSYEAGNFSVKLSEDSMRGIKLAIKEGRHAGGLPPYGYDVDPVTKKYLKNNFEAKIVNEIYDRFNSGESYKAIVKLLNQRGIRNKKGNEWKHQNVYLILRSKKYLGVLSYGRTTNKDGYGNAVRNIKVPDSQVLKIDGALPKIIEESVYSETQNRLNNNFKKAGSYKATRNYLLSGLIVCSECQKRLSGMTRSSSGRACTQYISYYCVNKKAKTCSIKELPAKKIEKAAIVAVLPLIFNKHRIKKVRKIINTAFHENSATKAKADDLQQSLNQCEERRERFLEAIGAGLSVKAMGLKIQEADLAIETLTNEIEKLDNQKLVTKKSLKKVVEKMMSPEKGESSRHLTTFLANFVDRITVDNEKVEIFVTVDVGKKTCKTLKASTAKQ